MLSSLAFLVIAPMVALFGAYLLSVIVERVQARRLYADTEALRLAVLSGAVKLTYKPVPPMPARLRTYA